MQVAEWGSDSTPTMARWRSSASGLRSRFGGSISAAQYFRQHRCGGIRRLATSTEVVVWRRRLKGGYEFEEFGSGRVL
ncbi:unnamed protein product [Lactuca virosa]|uniref:Uncharacterized protein n=1 Tax=Lactuca virosa TaxID=75947 RepID=A0AAU9PSS8_9ASTR|nr:unnamed protein product [Lactuca virosa]